MTRLPRLACRGNYRLEIIKEPCECGLEGIVIFPVREIGGVTGALNGTRMGLEVTKGRRRSQWSSVLLT
jgi:hypothetical protein